jgi:hypothetical protein
MNGTGLGMLQALRWLEACLSFLANVNDEQCRKNGGSVLKTALSSKNINFK